MRNIPRRESLRVRRGGQLDSPGAGVGEHSGGEKWNDITRGELDEPPSYDENGELLKFQGLVNPGETQNGIGGSVEPTIYRSS